MSLYMKLGVSVSDEEFTSISLYSWFSC